MAERGGFWHIVDEEQILRYLHVSIEQRLQWLEAANQFLLSAMPPDVRELWQKFRRGEI